MGKEVYPANLAAVSDPASLRINETLTGPKEAPPDSREALIKARNKLTADKAAATAANAAKGWKASQQAGADKGVTSNGNGGAAKGGTGAASTGLGQAAPPWPAWAARAAAGGQAKGGPQLVHAGFWSSSSEQPGSKYGNLSGELEKRGAAGAGNYIKDLRKGLTPDGDRALLASTLAAKNSAGRTAALKEFGSQYANIDLDAYKGADGKTAAKTPDERFALGYMLAQNPGMTPEDFKTVQEYAMMGNAAMPAVWGNNSLPMRDTVPPGYERVTDYASLGLSQLDFQDGKSHFYASLFRNKETGKYVLAFPGTQTASDWGADISQDLGFSAKQYKLAMRLGDKVKAALTPPGAKESNLVGVTGHSKGGGQAVAVAMMTGIPAITFNAAGVNPVTVGVHELERKQYYELLRGRGDTARGSGDSPCNPRGGQAIRHEGV